MTVILVSELLIIVIPVKDDSLGLIEVYFKQLGFVHEDGLIFIISRYFQVYKLMYL